MGVPRRRWAETGVSHTLCAVLSVIVGAHASSASIPVTLPSLGKLTGKPSNASEEIAFFGGIPYGQAPIGVLRWQPPQPFGGWQGTRDASTFGNRCAQVDTITPRTTPAAEDCLFLNVFAPVKALNTNAKLPVMVYIHGGSYTTGESNDYGGSYLVKASNMSLIVVTINYRLAQFGFLASTELQATTSDGSVGNFGIQDQRLAIAWVKQHVAGFGGDGEAITIFGESAGGNSVINHVAAPASAGLFRAAIIESGAYDMGAGTIADAEKVYDTLKTKMNCADLACLRAAPASALLAALPEATHWGPVVDGHALTATPVALISHGQHNKVPIMMGSNRDEGAFFTLLEKLPWQMTEVQYDILSTKTIPNATERAMVKMLYASGGNYPYPANLGPFSHWWWVYTRGFTDQVPGLGPCAVRWLAKLLVDNGTPSVHAYLFAEPTACNITAYPWECSVLEQSIPGITTSNPIVVPHAVEINYAFGVTPLMPVGDQVRLAQTASQYWAAFGRSGKDPNLEGLTAWPSYVPTDDTILRLEGASGGGVRLQSHLRKEVCDFWQSTLPEVVA